jgi:cytosine/adenosine deaminase-related metal-dependent hydrolase
VIRYRAAWVLPIDRPPIAGGIVTVDRDVIVAVNGGEFDVEHHVGHGVEHGVEHDGLPVEDLGNVAILPGLVNAHTHLELSWMRGQVPPSASMPAWVSALMALRRTVSHEPAEPIVAAIAEARASGTALVGDVTNTFATYDPLLDSTLSAALFRELLGFANPDPDGLVASAVEQIAALTPVEWLRASVVPHAPYSVSPALLRAIGKASAGKPVSVHLGESAQEIEFLWDGTGEWRALLESLGAWNPSWTPPACGPVEYLDRHGLVSDRLLAVHGVRFEDEDIARLARANATIVACPRSNRWTGAGNPPIDRFYASGARVAIGTDSLASVEDLNLFHEMEQVRRLAPSVPASRILRSATLAGAQALGFAAELGSITPGKRAELLAVSLPPGIADVEEHLVSGINPYSIAWLREPVNP